MSLSDGEFLLDLEARIARAKVHGADRIPCPIEERKRLYALTGSNVKLDTHASYLSIDWATAYIRAATARIAQAVSEKLK